MTDKLIGTKPNQVPSNSDLGTLAYQNADNVIVNKLDVADSYPVLKVRSVINSGNNLAISQGTNSYITASSNSNLYISAKGNADLLNLVNGNVGIGTSAPNSRLHVDHSISSTAANIAESKSVATISVSPLRNGSAYGMYFGNDGTNTGYVQVTDGTNASSMNINPFGGNVGIGTTTPAVPLDIMPDSSKRVFGSQQNSTQHGFCEYIISGTIGANAVTITMQCPSYFQAEVVATFQQSNGGTDMNVYYNGIWSNNHTTHLFKNKTDGGTVPRIGGPLAQNPTYSVGVGDAASNSGKLIFTKAAQSGSSGTYCVRVIAYGYSNASMTYVVS